MISEIDIGKYDLDFSYKFEGKAIPIKDYDYPNTKTYSREFELCVTWIGDYIFLGIDTHAVFLHLDGSSISFMFPQQENRIEGRQNRVRALKTSDEHCLLFLVSNTRGNEYIFDSKTGKIQVATHHNARCVIDPIHPKYSFSSI